MGLAVNIDSMRGQVARAALAILPTAPNAELRIDVPVLRGAMGEPVSVAWIVAPISLMLRGNRSRWSLLRAPGDTDSGRQRILMAVRPGGVLRTFWGSSEVDTQTLYWGRGYHGGVIAAVPRNSAVIAHGADVYTIERTERQDVPDVSFYVVEGKPTL